MARNRGVELARRWHSAVSRQDFVGALKLAAADATLHIAGFGLMAGDYSGTQAIAAYLEHRSSETGASWREELEAIAVDGATVVAAVRITARRRDLSLVDEAFSVWRADGGRLAEQWLYFGDEAAVDAFWG